MTTIHKLPEEILLNVFDNLYASSLLQCQKVHRSWYLPAHITLLRELSFTKVLEIKKFIASIDYNPDQAYLNAIKKIHIHIFSPELFDRDDTIEKLFYRFKNLERIGAICDLSLFETIKDGEGFLTACPKLKTFNIVPSHCDTTIYYSTVWKLRHVMTNLEVSKSKYGGIARFLSSFPRLNMIYSSYFSALNFREILSAFEHSDNLQFIHGHLGQVEENFAERYLATKKEDIQELIVKRLSQVRSLETYEQDRFCVNSIKFINKYLTGLDYFKIDSHDNDHWTEPQRQVFHNHLLHILFKAKSADVAVLNMQSLDLLQYFATIVNNIFHSVSSARQILQFTMTDIHSDENLVNLNIESKKDVRKVYVSFSNVYILQDSISDTLDQVKSINSVDKFVLVIDYRDTIDSNDDAFTIDSYCAIFDKIPSLKHIALDIPMAYEDRYSESRNTYPLVETLTFRSIPHKPIQKLLDSCSSTFPNLKQLGLHYFSGLQSEGATGESRVELSGYNLEKLDIDVTTMLTETFNNMEKDFFVIVVGTGERYVYKVPLDLSSISVMNSSELDGLTLGQDYLHMCITIDSLERLEVCGIAHVDGKYV